MQRSDKTETLRSKTLGQGKSKRSQEKPKKSSFAVEAIEMDEKRSRNRFQGRKNLQGPKNKLKDARNCKDQENESKVEKITMDAYYGFEFEQNCRKTVGSVENSGNKTGITEPLDAIVDGKSQRE